MATIVVIPPDVLQLSPVAFASLPAVPLSGMVSCVSNSSVNGFGNTANGSGALKVLVWYNGANWTVIGA
jgi:hypothetical protein